MIIGVENKYITMLFSLRATLSVINNHALLWAAHSPDYVLNEEVVEWLNDNNIGISIDYDADDRQEHVDYRLFFNTEHDAILFKMRWL